MEDPCTDCKTQMSSQRLSPPSAKDILRYRYQHGTNLGGIFNLEQWLYPGMHDEGVFSPTEIDAVVSSLNQRGLEKTRARWEAHWAQALTDDDLNFLTTTARANHIRLPIAYWRLGPDFCVNTPFAMQPSEVYINAWSAVKQLCSRCLAQGIGILIDLHAGPGGFGHEPHSGSTNGDADFWNNDGTKDLATRCVAFIAQEVTHESQLAGVTGIQVCNEAICDASGMYEWYNDVIQKISKIDNTIPLYISDGWDMPRALKFTRAYNTVDDKRGDFRCPVIVDNHRYYCFDAKDTSRSPSELVKQVQEDLHEFDESLVGNVFELKAAVAVYIGEYSIALAPETWSKERPETHEAWKGCFALTQNNRWQQIAIGSAFWTLKTDWISGGDWGFKEQVRDGTGNIRAPSYMCLDGYQIRNRVRQAEEQRGRGLGKLMRGHTEYWEKTAPGGKFEHWRFADGWSLGWSDARAFFSARIEHVMPCKGRNMAMQGNDGHEVGGECCEPVSDVSGDRQGDEELERVGGDRIGALDLWVLKRMREVKVARRQECAFGWEWEQGFRKGVKEFESVVSVGPDGCGRTKT